MDSKGFLCYLQAQQHTLKPHCIQDLIVLWQEGLQGIGSAVMLGMGGVYSYSGRSDTAAHRQEEAEGDLVCTSEF